MLTGGKPETETDRQTLNSQVRHVEVSEYSPGK